MIQNGKIRTHNLWCVKYFSSSGLHKKQFTFFRPSEYISQDFKQYGVSKEKTESRIDVKEKFKDDEIYKDREEQIKAIEKTFEDALVRFSLTMFLDGIQPPDSKCNETYRYIFLHVYFSNQLKSIMLRKMFMLLKYFLSYPISKCGNMLVPR